MTLQALQVSQSKPKIDLAGIGNETIEIGPKIYLNGFPKSGLHLAVLMTAMVATPMPPKPWAGNLYGNAWTTNRIDDDLIIKRLALQVDGTWLKGHSAHSEKLEKALWDGGQGVAFIYRDLRDVAVSASYHVESPNDETHKHPGKAEFMALPSHEDRLMAIVTGLGEYAGLIERWEMYAPWLDVPWVLPVRYEEMIRRPLRTVSLFIHYVTTRSAGRYGMKIRIDQGDVEKLTHMTVEKMGHTEWSPTYRAGRIGDWQKEFTPAIKEAFKERAGDWLIKLGYEKDNDW